MNILNKLWKDGEGMKLELAHVKETNIVCTTVGICTVSVL